MPVAVLSLLPMVGCAAMMVLCARMIRGHGAQAPAADDEVTQLRAEVADLRARLDEPAQSDVQPRVH